MHERTPPAHAMQAVEFPNHRARCFCLARRSLLGARSTLYNQGFR